MFQAPFACLWLEMQGEYLTRLEYLPPNTPPITTPLSGTFTPIGQALQGYFATGQVAAVPLLLQGTAFQQQVWQALQGIPSGTTQSYGELAKRLQTSPRAVGNACRQNPIPLFIPCHRVVAARGIGGFMGKQPHGAHYKQWLLDFEARHHG